MAFYRRSFRRYRATPYRSGFNRSWRRRGWYRRGTAYNQRQGRRTFNVSIPVENVLSVTVPANNSWSGALTTCPFMADQPATAVRFAVSLLHSLLYRTYTRLYDQAKINSVSLTFDLISPLGVGGLAPAIKVYTTWDRCYDSLDAGGSPPSVNALVNGSESMCQMFVNNSRASLTRYNRASDLQERSSYHDCSYETTTVSGVSFWKDISWGDSCKFYSPSCCFAIQTGDTTTTDRVFPVSVRATYNVTFRNPKYGLSTAPSKGGDVEDILDGVEPVKVAGAGKSVAKTVTFDAGAVSDVLPAYSGLLGDVVDRLTANMHEEGVYSDGEYDHDEDIQFGYEKLGDEVFHQLFKKVYDDDLKKFGLIGEKEESA